MILTHGANSLQVSSGGAVIGGRTYRTVVMPDGKEWLAENLDYKWTGLTVDASGTSDSEPRASYYNNDEATYGIDGTYKCGLLYNHQAVKYLNDNKSTLCPGWHVPSSTEWYNLLTACGGAGNTSGMAMAAEYGSIASSFPGWNTRPTDDYGFSILPCGRKTTSWGGSFDQFNDNGFYNSSDNGIYASWMIIDKSTSTSTTAYGDIAHEISLRLVKD